MVHREDKRRRLLLIEPGVGTEGGYGDLGVNFKHRFHRQSHIVWVPAAEQRSSGAAEHGEI